MRLIQTAFSILALLVGPAVASANESSFCFGDEFQEPAVDLSKYRSVQTRSGQDSNLAVAVAISGGGHRAANFGAGVLMALEATPIGKRNLLAEVDYLSTVSGGGFAAASYVSSLHDHLTSGAPPADYSFRTSLSFGPGGGQLAATLERDYVMDVVCAMFSPRTWGALDRGDFLELALDDHVLGAARRAEHRSLTFGDMFVRAADTKRPRLPYWFANTTVFENGAIFTFSPDQFQTYGVVEYTHRLEKESCSSESAKFPDNVPLSLGLKASGSLPGAIPATTLRSNLDADYPFVHLLDGALADNMGFVTAVRLLRQEVGRRKLLIVIDAYHGACGPFSGQEGEPGVPGSVQRALVVGIDSWRGRSRAIIRSMCRDMPDGIPAEVIFLSFDDLRHSNPSVRDEAREIGTWYDITPEDQSFLFGTAEQVVEKKRPALIRAVGIKGLAGS